MTLLLNRAQACAFVLHKQGLSGERRFRGESGVLSYVQQAGCVQFDPIDACGRNAHLTLQSRVAGFEGAMLEKLLYEDRALIDHFDKNMAIVAAGDWPLLRRTREWLTRDLPSAAEVESVRARLLNAVAERGPLCTKDIDLGGKVDWYWNHTHLARAAMETLCYRGELMVHHKSGTIKYYDLPERCLPPELLSAPDPYPDEAAHMAFRVKRRIGASGLLWNRASDALLSLPLKSKAREAAFDALLHAGEIVPVEVQDVGTLYALAEDAGDLTGGFDDRPRTELIAPLDNLMWDRRLIEALFGYQYRWEIYTPAAKRRYGYYVLPLLFGGRFAGRVEPVLDRNAGALVIKNVWLEPGVVPSKRLDDELMRCFHRFARTHGVSTVVRLDARP